MSTATPPVTDLRRRLDDLLQYIRKGRILEAMREFYDDDVVMEEPAYGKTEGLAANLAREKQFVDGVKEWKTFDVHATAVGDNVTMYECVMDWITTDDQPVHAEQVAVARWRDGRIVHERFYYDASGA